MKKFFPVFILFFSSSILYAQAPPINSNTAPVNTDAAVMTFDSTTYHFPDTPQGKKVELELYFKNTGNEPLIITNCMTACGCDVATAPKEPIPPGAKGTVKYVLDTNSRMGPQSKDITITYNNGQLIHIRILGKIISPEAAH